MIREVSAICVAACLATTSLLAAPSDTIRSRVEGLRELGAAFKSVNDGLRTSEPQTILIQQAARQIRNAATQMPGWFPPGSGPESRLKTAARPEIWTQPTQFMTARDAFIAEATKFQTTVNSGNVPAIRAGARALAGTCKSCHDGFRIPSS